MTREHRPVRRFRAHVPVSTDARTSDRRYERLLEAHPGIHRAVAAREGRLLIIDYDPLVLGLADLAAIVRLGGVPVAPGDG